MTTNRLGLVIGLGFFSTLALAQAKQDPLEACYQQPDGAPRLACFNREMQRRRAAAATGPAATTPAAAAPPPPAPSAGNPAAEKATAEPVKPIVATIVRVVPRAHNESAFVLDNGQTWEQVESMENLDVKLHDAVTIKPGILGAFFLITPRSQRVRVHRML